MQFFHDTYKCIPLRMNASYATSSGYRTRSQLLSNCVTRSPQSRSLIRAYAESLSQGCVRAHVGSMLSMINIAHILQGHTGCLLQHHTAEDDRRLRALLQRHLLLCSRGFLTDAAGPGLLALPLVWHKRGTCGGVRRCTSGPELDRLSARI